MCPCGQGIVDAAGASDLPAHHIQRNVRGLIELAVAGQRLDGRRLIDAAVLRRGRDHQPPEEHEAGIRAVGMPILDIGGRLRAAISVAAPAFRCSAEQLTEFLSAMRSAADNIKILLPSS